LKGSARSAGSFAAICAVTFFYVGLYRGLNPSFGIVFDNYEEIGRGADLHTHAIRPDVVATRSDRNAPRPTNDRTTLEVASVAASRRRDAKDC